MTRACLALAEGDLEAAWRYHPLSLGLVALAAGFALAPRLVRSRWSAVPRRARTAILASCLILVLALWTRRLGL
jgi:hypothetical protein